LRTEAGCGTISCRDVSGGVSIVADEDGADGAEEPESRSSWSREIGQWLANPLLVTVVAVLLGSWLIPQVTRKWQDHQKALEIKTGLVGQMSESVSGAVASSRFVAAELVQQAFDDPVRAEQRAWNDAYREWTTESASIGAKIHAYIGSEVGSDWRRFGDDVTNFIQLSARNDRRSREAQVQAIYDDADLRRHVDLSKERWKALANPRSNRAFRENYQALAIAVLARRDELVQDVLDSSVSGF
jgi:hypothetical protein